MFYKTWCPTESKSPEISIFFLNKSRRDTRRGYDFPIIHFHSYRSCVPGDISSIKLPSTGEFHHFFDCRLRGLAGWCSLVWKLLYRRNYLHDSRIERGSLSGRGERRQVEAGSINHDEEWTTYSITSQ